MENLVEKHGVYNFLMSRFHPLESIETPSLDGLSSLSIISPLSIKVYCLIGQVLRVRWFEVTCAMFMFTRSEYLYSRSIFLFWEFSFIQFT